MSKKSESKTRTTGLRYKIDRTAKGYGNPLKTHDVPGVQTRVKLRHDESWVSRGFKPDADYLGWGRTA